jgi:hypothetical protein
MSALATDRAEGGQIMRRGGAATEPAQARYNKGWRAVLIGALFK